MATAFSSQSVITSAKADGAALTMAAAMSILRILEGMLCSFFKSAIRALRILFEVVRELARSK
jgi:hypothetical protein